MVTVSLSQGAEALVAAAVEGATRHGSRQAVAAATAAAVWTAWQLLGQASSGEERHDEEEEVHVRLAAVRPVVAAQVKAGPDGAARLSGRARAQRNVATHSLLGHGPEAIRAALQHPQATQRGGKRRGQAAELAPRRQSERREVEELTSEGQAHCAEPAPPDPDDASEAQEEKKAMQEKVKQLGQQLAAAAEARDEAAKKNEELESSQTQLQAEKRTLQEKINQLDDDSTKATQLFAGQLAEAKQDLEKAQMELERIRAAAAARNEEREAIASVAQRESQQPPDAPVAQDQANEEELRRLQGILDGRKVSGNALKCLKKQIAKLQGKQQAARERH